MPRLENWEIFYDDSKPRLSGNVFNDDRFFDGTSIFTSQLIELTDKYAKTKNTLYELGKRSSFHTYQLELKDK